MAAAFQALHKSTRAETEIQILNSQGQDLVGTEPAHCRRRHAFF